jgi:hypothetical protein
MPNKWHICKEGQAGNTKDNCLCFLNYLAFLQPAADGAVSILPWIVSPGRSYEFLSAGSIIQKNVRRENPTPAYSPVSDRRRLTALVEVHWARRMQAPMPQMSGPNLQENHIMRCFHRGNRCTEKMENGTCDTFIGSLDRLPSPSANRQQTHGEVSIMPISENCSPSIARKFQVKFTSP